MNQWYEQLNRPPLTPPNWIFGPVWTVLYLMIASSIFIFFKNRPAGANNLVLVFLGIHLISNFIWTWLFFGLKAPGFALIDIVILDITLVYLIFSFWPVSKASAILLCPYLCWVLFATYLNAAFFWLNR
ncbi:MAG: hypothetical protein Kow0029_00520 [Candidatus Rifleibacteriota bacterium]